MLFPNGDVSWKSSKARLPQLRTLAATMTRARFIASIVVLSLTVLLWRGVRYSSQEISRHYCFGPSKPPGDMSPNEYAAWYQRLQTPVIFNRHEPYVVNSSTIQSIDLNPIESTPHAASKGERVLILTPLRDAAYYLKQYFTLVADLTYPHDLIDLAFLVGDTSDNTLAVLASEVKRIQEHVDKKLHFRSVTVVQKDFGDALSGMDVESRHGFEAQGPRRKLLGKARNYLLYSALKPDHSWVYWRDVDIVESPKNIIEDMVKHDKDIIVPNIWFHRYDKDGKDIEGRFDYNSWIESKQGLKLAKSLPPDTVLAEGYKQYSTGRTYMCRMGHWTKDKHEEIELDGIGGVNIVVKAHVHRAGINFPSYAFENQAETEGFAKMAKRAGYQVIGLPNYIVWHIDTDEKPGNA